MGKKEFSGFRNYFNGNLLEICSLPQPNIPQSGIELRFLWSERRFRLAI